MAVLPPKVETVWETVKTLKPMDRGALYLFYYEGYSTGEIAQMLRVSQSSVTSRLCRARKKLKEQLEQCGFTVMILTDFDQPREKDGEKYFFIAGKEFL